MLTPCSHLKPYWTSELSELHNGTMRARRVWCEAGRPRGKESGAFLQYKKLKTVFRRRHRQCVQQYLSSLDRKLEIEATTDCKFLEKSQVSLNVT